MGLAVASRIHPGLRPGCGTNTDHDLFNLCFFVDARIALENRCVFDGFSKKHQKRLSTRGEKPSVFDVLGPKVMNSS